MGNGSKADILLVDDDPENIKVLGNLLVDDYRVRVATNGNDALEIVSSEDPPELVILDLVMPGMDGYEVCRKIKNIESRKDIPVLMIVTGENESEQSKGFNAGASDYISKPFKADAVKARIHAYAVLRRQLDNFGERAFIDSLTGLPNGSYFENILLTVYDDAVKSSKPFSVIRIAIDAYEEYVKVIGSEASDRCVLAVAKAIRIASGANIGMVYRIGLGDFACILVNIGEKEAFDRAEAIRSRVSSLEIPYKTQTGSAFVSVSLGVASIHFDIEESAFELVRSAEHALFRAVQQGGNQTCSAESNKYHRISNAKDATIIWHGNLIYYAAKVRFSLIMISLCLRI